MAKAKTAYVCTECGADYSKWQGQCTACQAWNTVIEVRGISGNNANGIVFDQTDNSFIQGNIIVPTQIITTAIVINDHRFIRKSTNPVK